MVTGHGGVDSIAAGVYTVLIIGDYLDGVGHNLGHNHGAFTGSAAVGTGAGGLHVTGTHMGEIQGHIDRTAAAAGADGHGGTLCVIVIFCLVILVIVTEQEDDVHVLTGRIDDLSPLVGISVVIAAVQQRLMAGNEHGLAVIQSCNIGGELCQGCGQFTAGSKNAGVIAVIGGGIGHADGINIIVAVIGGAVNTIGTGTVNQTGVVRNGGVPVMVRPGIEHIHIGIAQTGANVLGDGIQTAKVIGAVAGEHVTNTGNRAEIQTGFCDRTHNVLGLRGLAVRFGGMQITEENRSIYGFGCRKGIHGDQGENHHQHKQRGKESLDSTCRSHFKSPYLFFMGTAIAVRYRILCCPNTGRGVTSNCFFSAHMTWHCR